MKLFQAQGALERAKLELLSDEVFGTTKVNEKILKTRMTPFFFRFCRTKILLRIYFQNKIYLYPSSFFFNRTNVGTIVNRDASIEILFVKVKKFLEIRHAFNDKNKKTQPYSQPSALCSLFIFFSKCATGGGELPPTML